MTRETSAPRHSVQDIEAEKLANTRRLFEAMNLKQMQEEAMQSVFDTVAEQIRAGLASDDISQEFVALALAKLREKFRAADFLTPLIAIYDQHFSSTELGELIAFFSSATGRHWMRVQQQVVSESAAVGAQMGKRLVEESMREALAERPKILEQAPVPASGRVN